MILDRGFSENGDRDCSKDDQAYGALEKAIFTYQNDLAIEYAAILKQFVSSNLLKFNLSEEIASLFTKKSRICENLDLLCGNTVSIALVGP